jgi:hypothetical protein
MAILAAAGCKGLLLLKSHNFAMQAVGLNTRLQSAHMTPALLGTVIEEVSIIISG